MPTDLPDRTTIAERYCAALRAKHPHASTRPGEMHFAFADAMLQRDPYRLKHLANGMNDVAKAVFGQLAGVPLPKGQAATWSALLSWAGTSPIEDRVRTAQLATARELQLLRAKAGNADIIHEWIKGLIGNGFNRLVLHERTWYLAHSSGKLGHNLSERGTRLHLARPLIEALIELQQAQSALDEATQRDLQEAA